MSTLEKENSNELDSVQNSIKDQLIVIDNLNYKRKLMESGFILMVGLFFVFLVSSVLPEYSYNVAFLIFHLFVIIKLFWNIKNIKFILTIEKSVLGMFEDVRSNIYNKGIIPNYIHKPM